MFLVHNGLAFADCDTPANLFDYAIYPNNLLKIFLIVQDSFLTGKYCNQLQYFYSNTYIIQFSVLMTCLTKLCSMYYNTNGYY